MAVQDSLLEINDQQHAACLCFLEFSMVGQPHKLLEEADKTSSRGVMHV